jgi:hypothetical protein
MAQAATASPVRDQSGQTAAQFVDRWIYVFMVTFLIVVTLTGFIPDSVTKIATVEAGKRPPFPLSMHIHALVTGAWLLLLLAQTTLVAAGRRQGHRSLGRLAAVLGPLLVVNGVVLAFVIYRQNWNAALAIPGHGGQQILAGQANTTLLRIKHLSCFAVLVTWAMKLRLRDLATHKRLMILAPLSIMAVAFARMAWMPTTMPVSPMSLQLFVPLLAAPMFAWDIYRTGKVQRAYFIWLGIYLPTSLAVHLLWNSPWWLGVVPHLMGVV